MNSPSREIEWCKNLSYRCKNTQQYQKGTHGTKIDEANTKIVEPNPTFYYLIISN